LRKDFESKNSELSNTKRKLEVFEASQDEEFSTNFKKRNKLGEYADDEYKPQRMDTNPKSRLNTEFS
jgi:hypothetical protein